MSDLAQSIIVALIVLSAIAYLILRTRKKSSSCNKGCGCAKPSPVPRRE